MDTLAVTARADLTDAQWAVLEPLLPKGKKSGRPPKWSKRQLIDGVRWRVRVGSPWRDVPPQYGPWQTVYGLFRRWQRNGTWARILTGLQAIADAAGLITSPNRPTTTAAGYKPSARSPDSTESRRGSTRSTASASAPHAAPCSSQRPKRGHRSFDHRQPPSGSRRVSGAPTPW